MQKGQEKPQLQEQLHTKMGIHRYQQYRTQSNVGLQKANYVTQSKKDSRSQSFIFNIRVRDPQNQFINHKKSKNLLKKYVIAQNRTQVEDQDACVSYKQRKLLERRKSQEKQLQNNKQKRVFNKPQAAQGKFLKLLEILSLQRKGEKSTIDPKRSQLNMHDKKKANLFPFNLQNSIQPKKSTATSSQNTNMQHNSLCQIQDMKFKNVKVTLKQLIKAQKFPAFQRTVNKCLDSQLLKSINLAPQQFQKFQNEQLNPSNRKQFFEQEVNNPRIINTKSKIKSHIRQSKSQLGYVEKIISSVITIKPSNFQQKVNNFSGKQLKTQLSYKSSRKNITQKDFHPKKTYKQKREELKRDQPNLPNSPNQLEGWEYKNDFSERQSLF